MKSRMRVFNVRLRASRTVFKTEEVFAEFSGINKQFQKLININLYFFGKLKRSIVLKIFIIEK